MEIQQNAVNVFISYDQSDETVLHDLENHLSILKQEGLISIWHHSQIAPGTNRTEAIDQQLQQAAIIVLLVSANFLASDYYHQIKVKHILERQKAGTAHLVPIISRACDWKHAPFAHLAVLPDTEKPLTEWPDRDAAFSHIVAGIRRIVEELARPSERGFRVAQKTEPGSIRQPGQLGSPHQQPHPNYPLPRNPIAGMTTMAKWVIITIIAAIVLGTPGVLAFHPFHLFLTQPEISVASKYNAQGLPVGTDGTTFHVSGQHFAANSTITFLLDNIPLNEAQQTQSDGNGNVTADLAVTSTWSIGQHTLTAHDAGNTFTTSGMQINIAQPGESNTPGPNGAPPDDASFTIQVNGQGTNANGVSSSYPYILKITGHPDPAGGSVCAPWDNGTPISFQGPPGSGTTNSTSTYSCSGTYKGGKFSYFETLQTRMIRFSSGVTCTVNAPIQSYQYITGSYTSQHNFSGDFAMSPIGISMSTCTLAGYGTWAPSGQGNWTGTVS